MRRVPPTAVLSLYGALAVFVLAWCPVAARAQVAVGGADDDNLFRPRQVVAATSTPTPTPVPPTATRTPTRTSTATPSPTRTITATFTNTSLPPATSTSTSTSTPSPTRTVTATFTNTSLPPATSTSTSTSTPSPTRTITATFTNTVLPPPAITPLPARLTISDAGVVEGSAGLRDLVFTVEYSGPRALGVTVDFGTKDGTATAGSDYIAASGTLTFNPLVSTRTITVQVRGDQVREPTETLFVILGNAAGATIVDGEGEGRIFSDEIGVPVLISGDQRISAGAAEELTLRWEHPERWRELATVDLRLADAAGPVLWVRFDEAANTFAICDAAGACGTGVAPGDPTPLRSVLATFFPADSRSVGSGPEGQTVDLVYSFAVDRAVAGRALRVESAATDDDGNQQEFVQVGTLSVAGSDDNDDGCRVGEPAPVGGPALWLTAGLLLLWLGRRRQRKVANRG